MIRKVMIAAIGLAALGLAGGWAGQAEAQSVQVKNESKQNVRVRWTPGGDSAWTMLPPGTPMGTSFGTVFPDGVTFSIQYEKTNGTGDWLAPYCGVPLLFQHSVSPRWTVTLRTAGIFFDCFVDRQ